MNKDRLSLGVITALDPNDHRTWSGIPAAIVQALQKQCGNVTCLGPLDGHRAMRKGKLVHASAQFLRGRRFAYAHTHHVSQEYARILKPRLAQGNYDAIIAISGATELAWLQTSLPTVLIEDANFALLHDYYPQFTNLLSPSARQLEGLQRRAIAKADLILYPTQWAAQSARDHYKADMTRIRVIPFGANLHTVPDRARILTREMHHPCQLLFVGVDWQRKGGGIAYQTLQELLRMGITAELTICGCKPPQGVTHPHMRVIPFLDKNDPIQRKQLENLYLQADIFLLPSRCECYGIVFCEASAYGLPTIATETGGVSEVIKNGINGYTLPPEETGTGYAEAIAGLVREPQKYHQLVQGSRQRFESLLNWDAWGISAYEAIQAIVDQQRSLVSTTRRQIFEVI